LPIPREALWFKNGENKRHRKSNAHLKNEDIYTDKQNVLKTIFAQDFSLLVVFATLGYSINYIFTSTITGI
jgi:hypothetical protein